MNKRLPEEWTVATLDVLLSALENGSRPRGGVRGIESGVPSIGGEHLTYKGTIDFSRIKYVPTEFAAGMQRGHIQPGDVLIVKDGATTGKTAFVGHDFPFRDAVVNEHVFICRPNPNIDPRYLFRFLSSEEGQKRLLENFRGSAQGGINQSFAANVEIPMAPLPQQRRIVLLLEALLQRIDECDQRLAGVPILTARMQESILAAACAGRLTADWRRDSDDLTASFVVPNEGSTEIPDSWSWVKLPETGEMGRGKSRHRPRNDPSLLGGSYPLIQTGDIAQSGGRITSHTQTYNPVGLAQSRMWPAGTVCITIAANIAESAILTYPACFPDSVVGIIADPKRCLPDYLEFCIRMAKANLAMFAPATAQKNINLAILSKVLVPLPPLEEQEEIVRRAGKLLTLIGQIQDACNATANRIDRLRVGILENAFRGELTRTKESIGAMSQSPRFAV